LRPEDLEPTINGFEFYLDAFRELHTSRPVGMDLQAIPFTAIAEYFRIYELQDFDDFAGIIRMMDNKFIELNDASRDKTGGGKNGVGNTDPKNSNTSRRGRG